MDCAGAGALDMTFRATRTAPRQVRALVVLRLTKWGLAGISDDVALIASELATNAVQHAAKREIRVRLTREPGAVVLAVWDSSDAIPVRKGTLGPDVDIGGRGLPIVEALSEDRGVTPTEPHGKWVWARCAAVGPSAEPDGSAGVLSSRR